MAAPRGFPVVLLLMSAAMSMMTASADEEVSLDKSAFEGDLAANFNELLALMGGMNNRLRNGPKRAESESPEPSRVERAALLGGQRLYRIARPADKATKASSSGSRNNEYAWDRLVRSTNYDWDRLKKRQPDYDWDRLKRTGYDWDRLKRNANYDWDRLRKRVSAATVPGDHGGPHMDHGDHNLGLPGSYYAYHWGQEDQAGPWE